MMLNNHASGALVMTWHNRVLRTIVVRIASAHNSRGAPAASNIVHALSNSVRFIRSATPFDWEEYPAVGLCSIPWDLTYSIISPMYSVPRWVRNSLILHPL